MQNQELTQHFKPGDIIAYYNHPDNAPHHRTFFGRVIETAQWVFWGGSKSVDTRVTHISMIDDFDSEDPEPGYTWLKIYDILLNKEVARRTFEHNYAFKVFRLRAEKQIHPNFTAEQLAKKAVEIVRQCLGVPYKRRTALEVFFDWHNREGKLPDSDYPAWLVERFKANLEDQSVCLDKEQDGVICPELVLGSYQIAWLMLSGEEAVNYPLPEWLNFHAQCTPAGLSAFLEKNEYFEAVSPEYLEELRYSGRADPRDLDSAAYVQKTWLLSQRKAEAVSENGSAPLQQANALKL